MFSVRQSYIKEAVLEALQERANAYERARMEQESADKAREDERKRLAIRAERDATRQLGYEKQRQHREKQIAESRQRKMEKQQVKQYKLEATPSYQRRLKRYDMIKNMNPDDLAKRNEEIAFRKKHDRAMALERAELRKAKNAPVIQLSSEVVAAENTKNEAFVQRSSEVVAAENTKKRRQTRKFINIKWFKKLAFWK